jgi:hypothetical protein
MDIKINYIYYKYLGIIFGSIFITTMILRNFNLFNLTSEVSNVFSILTLFATIRYNQLKVKHLETKINEINSKFEKQ